MLATGHASLANAEIRAAAGRVGRVHIVGACCELLSRFQLQLPACGCQQRGILAIAGHHAGARDCCGERSEHAASYQRACACCAVAFTHGDSKCGPGRAGQRKCGASDKSCSSIQRGLCGKRQHGGTAKQDISGRQVRLFASRYGSSARCWKGGCFGTECFYFPVRLRSEPSSTPDDRIYCMVPFVWIPRKQKRYHEIMNTWG